MHQLSLVLENQSAAHQRIKDRPRPLHSVIPRASPRAQVDGVDARLLLGRPVPRQEAVEPGTGGRLPKGSLQSAEIPVVLDRVRLGKRVFRVVFRQSSEESLFVYSESGGGGGGLGGARGRRSVAAAKIVTPKRVYAGPRATAQTTRPRALQCEENSRPMIKTRPLTLLNIYLEPRISDSRACVCVCVYLAIGLVQNCPFSRLWFLCGGGGGTRPPLRWGETCGGSILNTCSASASLPHPWRSQEKDGKRALDRRNPSGLSERHGAVRYLYAQKTEPGRPSPHTPPPCGTCHNF